MNDQTPHLSGTVLVELLKQHGPLMTGTALSSALGFPSVGALRQARHRQNLPVNVFSIPNRRGTFARTEDVALWIEQMNSDNPSCGIDRDKEAQ